MNTGTRRIGSGWLASCECGWEAVNAVRARSDKALLAHTTNHPAPKREKAAPKRASSRGAWDEREESSSWIDKL